MKKILFIWILFFGSAAWLGAQPVRQLGVKGPLPLSVEKQISAPVGQASFGDSKSDPLLRHLLGQYNHALALGHSPETIYQRFRETAGVLFSAEKGLRVSMMIKSSNPDQTKERIRALGGSTGSVINQILTAEIPIENVNSLLQSDEVLSIRTSGKSHLQLDVSRVEISADQVHAGIGLNRAYLGHGVVVGVLDSGIDWSHPDFNDNNGNTRIHYLWDMSGNGNPPSGYNYGTEYTASQISSGQCGEIDGDGGGGHGTHVSGTAAGGGHALSNYVGIAPEADLVFVKGIRDHNSNGGFSDSDVLDGCNYIFSQAQAMGKPASINLSLGGQLGAHDGTSLYEQALSGLTGPGKIINVAAGNDGSNLIHLSYATSGSTINDALQTFWMVHQNATISAVDMWYNSGSITVGLACYDQSLNLLAFTNPVSPGQNIENVVMTDGYNNYGLVSIDARTVHDPNNNASRVFFVIDSNNGQYPISSVFWTIYTFGNGTFDAWQVVGGNFTTDSDPYYGIMPGDNNKSVGIPGTSQQVVCVGSYVTKNQWIDIDGIPRQQPGNPVIGDISSFSSLGPSRDGRTKPDITAPGEVIVAALSSNLTIGQGVQRENIVQGGMHQKMQGTSMATPHVTGLVALMLERNGGLDYQSVINTLRNTARPQGSPNNTWGYGKINALAAMQNVVTGIEDPAEPIRQDFELAQNYPNPFNPVTNLKFRISDFGTVELFVFDMLGHTVKSLVSKELTAGNYEVQWDGTDNFGNPVSSGVYFYRLRAGSHQKTRKMLLMR